MGFGSVPLGGLADRVGRRPTALTGLFTMAVGTILATTAHTPQRLSVWRLLTGVGIGGMLAATNALVRELSSAKRRSFATSAMVIGYSLGAFVGGLVARELLKGGDWRLIFEFGAIMTSISISLVWVFIPETPEFLDQARRADWARRPSRRTRGPSAAPHRSPSRSTTSAPSAAPTKSG